MVETTERPRVVRQVHLHRAQADFRKSTALYRGFVGGRGAGKSWVGAYDLIRRAKRGRTYLVGSPTGVLLGDTTFPTFKAIAQDLGVWGSVKLMPYPTAQLSTGASVRFRTAEDPEKMRGPNLSGVWLDEASLMHEDAYSISIASLRESGEQGWLSSTFTPKGLGHWTYEVFGGKPPRHDTAIFHAATKQNPWLPKSFQETLEHQYVGLRAEQELEGRFVNVEGAEWPGELFEGDEDLALETGANGIWFRNWPENLTVRTIGLDPSKGRDAKHGDYRAFVLLGRDTEGTLYVEADLEKGQPSSLIVDVGIDLARRFKPDGIAVESNQFQELLAVEFLRVSQERGFVLPIHTVVNTVNKLVRIRRLTPYLSRRAIRFKAGSKGTRLLVQQLRDFPCGMHDDGPDALEMALRLAIELFNDRATGAAGRLSA